MPLEDQVFHFYMVMTGEEGLDWCKHHLSRVSVMMMVEEGIN